MAIASATLAPGQDLTPPGTDRSERPTGWAARPSAHFPDALGRRLMAVDALALLAGWSVGWVLAGRGVPLAAGEVVGTIVVGVVSSLACFSALHLYRHPLSGVRSSALGRVLLSLGVAALVTITGQSLLGEVIPALVLTSVGASLVIASSARYCFDVWLVSRRARGDFRVAVVVAGEAAETAALVEFLEVNPEAGFHAIGIVGAPPVPTDGTGEGVPWLGGLEHAGDVVRRTGAAGVLVAVNGLGSPTLNQLVLMLTSAGTPVYLSTGLTGISGARLQTIPLAHEPISLVRPPHHSTLQLAGKRVLDIVVAALLLVLTAPVVAVAALLIKAHDRGPVLFRQVRIGRDGEPFTLLKLRTMEVDAEARLAELRHRNERHGPLFKVSGDPRITPIGGLLRSTAIDELPQLVNVLTGRMSIVGPRPALPAEMAEFDEALQRRHLAKPGVTGLWQVEANHKASFDEYRRLDLFYVDNWSVAMDIAIMIDTVPAICRRGLRALRRPAPSAPAPVDSLALRHTAEVGP
ncbi:MAG TPA: sugar transferase [Acidimicrobiales bacterium]|nr:sugar transferase [Acidimicrobiales bacterium]